jgi:formate hydrogenlyase transcriptional activator
VIGGANRTDMSMGSHSISDRARVLLEINNAIVSHLDLKRVLKSVSDCLRREINHDFAGLALYNADKNELRLHALDFPTDQAFLEQGHLIPLTGTPASLAFSTRKPVLRHRPDFDEFPAEIMKRAYARGIRSGCAVPLLCHDKIVGSMVLASLRESAFTEDDADLLTQIGAQVAIAVDNAQNFEKTRLAQQQMERERDRSKLLLEVNNAVVSHLNMSDLLKSISARLSEVMFNDSSFIALCGPENTLQAFGVDLGKLKDVVFKEGLCIPMEGTPEETAIKTGRPVLVRSVADFQKFPSPWVQYAIDHGLQSACINPLISHDRTLGVLGVTSLREDAFAPEATELVEQISGQIAIAVENASNFEKTRLAQEQMERERDRSKLLLEVNNAVVSHLNLTELLKSVSLRLQELMFNDSVFIALCGPGETLELLAIDMSRLGDVGFKEGMRIPMEGTPEEEAIKTGRGVLMKSVADIEKFPSPWVRRGIESGVRSACVNPLIAHGRTLGALGVVSLREEAFTQESARLLAEISGQIAIAVENALNFEKTRVAEQVAKHERDRSKLLLDINNALVSHLDLTELVRAISNSLQAVVPNECVALAIYDSETGKLFAQAVSSVINPMPEGIYYDPDGTTSGLVFKSGRPLYLPRPDYESFPSPVTQGFYKSGLKSLYSMPITIHGRNLGVMSISSVREDAFAKDDQELFQQIANQVAIAAANALAVRDLETLKNKLAQEKLYLEDEIRNELNFDEIIGQSPALKQVLKLVETVAASDSTVLLLGETGTGKELIARAVHEHSRRKSRTFVKLNCAAIPTGLLESELFGHEKGAFTGAIAQKIGRLELADQGTLFLDEVGDIPVEIQPKLLRALQEREFERLGSTHTKKVNVRLVAATNRDLEKMIEERQFRGDLYYRLNVFPIQIPPLRERQEDIPLLVRYFAEKFARQMQKPIDSIPTETMSKLQRWHWPGNIRELENLIERAVILTTGTALQVPLPEIRPTSASVPTVASSRAGENNDREHIIKILRETGGMLGGPNGAAARLGIKRTTLQYKIKKLGITRNHWWPPTLQT